LSRNTQIQTGAHYPSHDRYHQQPYVYHSQMPLASNSRIISPSIATNQQSSAYSSWNQQLTQPYQPVASPYPNSSSQAAPLKFQDEISKVTTEILQMFLPSLKPSLMSILSTHNIHIPSSENLVDWLTSSNTHSSVTSGTSRNHSGVGPPRSEEEALVSLIENFWVPCFHPEIYPPSFQSDLPTIRMMIRDMVRIRERKGVGSVPKGDLMKFVRISERLWDACFYAGYEPDGKRAKAMIESWKRMLGC
jgi:hypothetical protein